MAMACTAVSQPNGKSLRVFVRVGVADKKVSCRGKSDSPLPTAGLPRAFAREVARRRRFYAVFSRNLLHKRKLSQLSWSL